jgi:hypothetical protein
MARKPTDTVQVNLRVPEWLRLDVLRRSKKSGRSFNGELIHLIQEGMAKPKNAALIKEAVDKASVATASRAMAELTALLAVGNKESLTQLLEKLLAANRAGTDIPIVPMDENDDRPHSPPR